VCVDFRNREEELKNALATSRSKIHGLEGKFREIEAGGLKLKRLMKEATESEYAVSQKLAYETATRRALEVEFEVVLKSLQSDQITIVGYEVELNNLKGAANYAMSCIPVPEEGGQQQSIIVRLVDVPNRMLILLRATGLAAATNALVRVKSHYPEVDMTKIKGGVDTTKDLHALEHVEGKGQRGVRTPRSCYPDVGFSQAPEHVEGGLWYEERGGSARLIAEDCLKYFLFNLKRRNTKGKNT
jgi:hypothetical protein